MHYKDEGFTKINKDVKSQIFVVCLTEPNRQANYLIDKYGMESPSTIYCINKLSESLYTPSKLSWLIKCDPL